MTSLKHDKFGGPSSTIVHIQRAALPTSCSTPPLGPGPPSYPPLATRVPHLLRHTRSPPSLTSPNGNYQILSHPLFNVPPALPTTEERDALADEIRPNLVQKERPIFASGEGDGADSCLDLSETGWSHARRQGGSTSVWGAHQVEVLDSLNGHLQSSEETWASMNAERDMSQ